MKRPSRRLTGALVVLSLLAGIVVVSACSNQGEGEVCNIENGNDDCKTDEGLICYDGNTLNRITASSDPADRCCPIDRTRATHPVCVTAIAVGGINDAQAPADTGPAPTTSDASVSDASETADATDQ